MAISLEGAGVSHSFILAGLSGILTHQICNRHEPASLSAFGAILFAGPAMVHSLSLSPLSVGHAFAVLFIHLGTLCLSITAYRLSPFHPLARYPGPVLARISRFWSLWGVVRGHQHVDSHELFSQYGKVVRTGPNHLIIRDANVIPTIHGNRNRWPRDARAMVMTPYNSPGSLINVIEPAEHDKIRRLWDRAFTSKAVISYEPMLKARAEQLMDNLTSRTGCTIDLGEWFCLFSMDFMGDFAFGGMFHKMADGKDVDNFHGGLFEFLKAYEMFGSIPWIRPIIQALPSSKAEEMKYLSGQVAGKREKRGSQTRDLFSYLLGEDEDDTTLKQYMGSVDISEEALLAMGAGSDTTALALTSVMYFLLSNPGVHSRLRDELDAAAGQDASYDQDLERERLFELPYLQAVINEALRLLPVIPNGIPRTSPKAQGPVEVAGIIVPPGTTVQVPTWSLHRDLRYFSPDPDTFWPDRWLPNAEQLAASRGQDYKLDQGAYMPFHSGPANCAGRSLALHTMRTILATLIRRFDLAFAPDFDAQGWVKQTRDQFVLATQPLNVVLSPRRG